MAALDLRSINLADKNILTFTTLKQAKKHPLPHLCYITQAANRFWLFYVIVRKSQNGDFFILRKDGQLFPFENYRLVGDKRYLSE
jgi:hypothetical protein